jgi:UDP-N-acetylmuramate--alanine ligase
MDSQDGDRAVGRAHLVGVAGVGMNPLAQALLAAGWVVSGSDRYLDTGRELAVIPKLRRAGVRLVAQDGSGVDAGLDAVVVSTAIEEDNPDLAGARRHGVSVLHRSEMLARLCDGRECIAITGTSGKTTVTGMVGHALAELGDDPTVVNGGIVVNWETDETVGNVRPGRSGRWVIEADESDRSLLHYTPDWAVITNESADHFPLAETRALFDAFASRVRREVLRGGVPAGFEPTLSASGCSFEHEGVAFRLPLLGRHNAENALQAARLCERLGHPLTAVSDALATFRGIRRRLDVAAFEPVAVIDDYAHNPAKIRAAWQAVAPHYDRVFAVWRPHGFGPLAAMYDALRGLFAEMAAACEQLLILPVYYVGGTTNRAVRAEELVDDLAGSGAAVEFAPDYDAVVSRIAGRARPGDVVLTMGARDPDLPALARRIAGATAQ